MHVLLALIHGAIPNFLEQVPVNTTELSHNKSFSFISPTVKTYLYFWCMFESLLQSLRIFHTSFGRCRKTTKQISQTQSNGTISELTTVRRILRLGGTLRLSEHANALITLTGTCWPHLYVQEKHVMKFSQAYVTSECRWRKCSRDLC